MMGWLIALGILVLLAILPLGAAVRYQEQGFSLKIIAGPVRIPIIPGKKKDPEAEKQKIEEKKKAKAAKAKSRGNAKAAKTEKKEKGGPITDFLPIVKTVLELLNSFRKKLRIKRLDLKLILAGDDPCDLGINYGRANAAMGNLLPQLERCFVIKKRNIAVECDFEATQTVILARADLTITLGALLALLVRYGIRTAKQYLAIQKSRKGGATK